MKALRKFIVISTILIVLGYYLYSAYYDYGFYVSLAPDSEPVTFTKVSGKDILLDRGEGYEPFEIKGVDLGSGKPGEWSTDFAITEEEYTRWFGQIKAMGANTVRIYTVQQDIFYNAFYEFNKKLTDGGEEPLFLIQGVWLNDYIQFSHLDAFSKEFKKRFITDAKAMVDVIHGNRRLSIGRLASAGSGTYSRDISQWVIGYILGVEWEPETVVYTNQINREKRGYSGEYFFTSADANPFEVMLAEVCDKVVEFETEKYGTQRLVAFSNWPTTDPFIYPPVSDLLLEKTAFVDAEHVISTDKLISGHFASYHIYPYFPDYLAEIKRFRTDDAGEADNLVEDFEYQNKFYRHSLLKAPNIEDYIREGDYTDGEGKFNSYRPYLSALNRYHGIPVVISEFGVSTGRGIAQLERYGSRNQGHMSEKEQGIAIVECYEDIKAAGCAGSCIFSWQDEWFKRTWNTMYAINMKRNPYWSDYQTNEQYFGLLSFDPGKEKSVAYIDGDVSEWSETDKVISNETGSVSLKYDERFLYLLVTKEDLSLGKDKLYIPFDITPKSGTLYAEEFGLKFERPCDFILCVGGRDNTRIKVHERYEALRSTYSEFTHGINTYDKENVPDIDSPKFVDINLILKTDDNRFRSELNPEPILFNTGKLKYGNSNPEDKDFDSLADFIARGDNMEIRIAWELLNFSDPSRMEIHDDYYADNYGVKYIYIKELFVGLTADSGGERLRLEKFPLNGWKNNVTYHERLKDSYYKVRDMWS